MSVAKALLVWAVFCMAAVAQAQPGAARAALSSALPAELRSELPTGQLAGRARLSVWGFQVYDAALWVSPGFKANAFADHAFALELAYLRGFTAAQIASRSVAEIGRQRPIQSERAAVWERQLLEVFPDVQAGDRITGIHQPGSGARFLVNGAFRKSLSDVEFSRLFFGIWLSEATSEPAMRRDLLSLVNP
jgi:Chalcone isomerase-like